MPNMKNWPAPKETLELSKITDHNFEEKTVDQPFTSGKRNTQEALTKIVRQIIRPLAITTDAIIIRFILI